MSGAASKLEAAAPQFSRGPCGTLWMRLGPMGQRAGLRCSGALWLPEEGVLVASDLHLEKGSFFAARGQLLPPYDTRDTLFRLEAELEALQPRVLVLLGDSFHDARATARLAPEDVRRIAALATGRELVWIVGNHDAEGPGALPGAVLDTLGVGGLLLRHEPEAGAAPGEVSGHLHPCAKVKTAGRAVRRRCFATDGMRLIAPAFGAYAGGLNLCDRAFDGLFAAPPIAAALGPDRVHPLPYAVLCGD